MLIIAKFVYNVIKIIVDDTSYFTKVKKLTLNK